MRIPTTAAAIAALTLGAPPATAVAPQSPVRICPVEATPRRLPHLAFLGTDPGGMINDGWDGSGANPTQLWFHMEGSTPDLGTAQRAVLLQALQIWANQVRVDFVELPLPNQLRSFDFDFLSGDHSDVEPQETHSSCAFQGAGQVIAHAGFPPGAASTCVNPMAESWAGNVHFDEAETWEVGDSPAAMDGRMDLLATAVHEIGHSLGLTHSDFPADIMFASLSIDMAFGGLSANDVANIRAGYEAGQGVVLTLPETGIWVAGGYTGVMLGTALLPFRTLAPAAAGLPPLAPSVPIYIDSGTYDESALVFDRAATLETLGGSVVIL